MKTGDSSTDFIQWLGRDMSMCVFEHLDDPSDLLRICAVSRSWRKFIIANGLCKQLWFRMFPELYSLAHVIESNNIIEPLTVKPGYCIEWECLKRYHRVYGFLARGLSPSIRSNCILEAICASSTDNYPEESIHNTLEDRDVIEDRASYWSSEGDSDPSAPEILLYKLAANLCVVTEIHIQPFQAYFQYGFPVYSAKTVVFRMGHKKCPAELDSDMTDSSSGDHDDKYIWTYTSPEYPMTQENCLQKFKLPEPALCIGGILQVELLGRVQRQEMDGLYYICISHVQLLGWPLSPPFDVEILDPSGKCILKYYPEAESTSSPRLLTGEVGGPSTFHTFASRLMQMRGWDQMILNSIHADGLDNDESEDEYNPDF